MYTNETLHVAGSPFPLRVSGASLLKVLSGIMTCSLATSASLLTESLVLHVGSPFPLRVSGASLLKVSGPGLQDGLLGRYQPQFTIDTSEAGKGEIKVEIGGPRGMNILFHS